MIKKALLCLYLKWKLLKRHRDRVRNALRDRTSPLEIIRGKTDSWFEKSYRLPRHLFYNLLHLINPILETKNRLYATNSSGSPLIGEVLLAATLRFLGGASYIDIVDLYKLPEKCHAYFYRTIDAIDKTLNNIQLPKTSAGWYLLSEQWNQKMESKLTKCYFPGTVLALDGIVVETRKPYHSEVAGDIVGNFNRKGFFGLVAISAVDAYGRFVFSELGWSGATNDSVAYRCTELAKVVNDGKIPDGLHIVADEAFSACSPQILTPYSRSSLREERSRNSESYSLKRSFNYLLSYQRCTVERSFGMLVRKFLILSKRFDCRRDKVRQIFRVCCKLLNFCITDWLEREKPNWNQTWNPIQDETTAISTQTIMNQMQLPIPRIRQPNSTNVAHQGPNREILAAKVRELGFVYDSRHLPVELLE